ncbi:translation elongation factor Ts [Coraliomargarita akajimensis]|uniref:Elongation factor Ts n=1 Tax=Coraliomargarita akajimensis (strain DSM 45221 / IAM 15411 / JCM 23193 / KCTC 12865 / 04OKA010-24) TaxID=583355 RepID=D5ENM8_CORAD|nr:translation elongation factor Ts [Coraliomargarita akajimensis]ADE55504.1 translation elongation factor Ts [Coraliomargarita akajimensis DSM 45221]
MSVQITAKMVGDLRESTGAGLMDCKKALVESEGDVEKAIELLRKKGVATAAKKAGRDASEGLIDTYIHLGGKVGVLCEINCESDFVAKTDDFKQFVRDIAMHIAAANPVCVSREDIDPALLEKEREVARGQAEGKPAQAVEKIVEGKVNKYLSENCLLEQAYVKNPDQTVQEVLTEMIAKMGENMKVNRFARFQVGA